MASLIWKENQPLGAAGDYVVAVISTIVIGLIDWYVIPAIEALSLPGTHYAVITRGVFLPGVGLDVLWPYGVMLIVSGVAFVAVAAFFFRKKLG